MTLNQLHIFSCVYTTAPVPVSVKRVCADKRQYRALSPPSAHRWQEDSDNRGRGCSDCSCSSSSPKAPRGENISPVSVKHPGDLPCVFWWKAVKLSNTCQKLGPRHKQQRSRLGFSFAPLKRTELQSLVFPDQLAETGGKWPVSASPPSGGSGERVVVPVLPILNCILLYYFMLACCLSGAENTVDDSWNGGNPLR